MFSSVAPLISIIIPVYNTYEYLRSCLDSVVSQSFTEFECILIDDGSTDGSDQICEEYVQKDNRFSVIHKKNGGVSSARNIGLDCSHGEWIYFVDSDDELFPDGLLTMVQGISDEVDVIMGGYEKRGTKGEVVESVKERRVLTLSKEQALLLQFPNHSLYYSYLGYMCIYLFRSRIIKENRLKFDSSIKIKEDTLFIVQYLCYSNGRTWFDTTPVYKYKLRDNSAMGVLEVEYSPDYQTSLDSVIQIHSCIMMLPGVGKELSIAAKNEVLKRVLFIYAKMKKFKAVDKGVFSSMKYKAVKEVGLPFYLLFQIRRYLQKARRKLNLSL